MLFRLSSVGMRVAAKEKSMHIQNLNGLCIDLPLSFEMTYCFIGKFKPFEGKH